MKFLDKIGLTLFSTIILIVSIIASMVIFNWIDINWLHSLIIKGLTDSTVSNIILGMNVAFMLLAIKCIFFESGSKDEIQYKNGILLENSDGKLLITKETLENLIISVVKGFESAEDVVTKVELDKENNVIVFVNLSVKENAIIKELSTNLQSRIKSTIKRATDLEVKQVNIKIKDIEPVKKAVQE